MSNDKKFSITSDFKPAGDQPEAIRKIAQSFVSGRGHQVLLGVTGSGKTFSMAHIIQKLNVPTLVLAPNKTLAAQLYVEFKDLFPQNAVEYFVSYYDYYQPEAYLPASDTFIEKDSSINEQIDRMRHSATRSLFDRSDVLIVSSVSCIYGLGSPENYEGMKIHLKTNQNVRRDGFLRELARVLYSRNNVDFHRGTFRAKGDLVDVFPTYEEDRALRVEFFGDYIDRLLWFDPVTLDTLEEIEQVVIYPSSHHVTTEEKTKTAIESIQKELLGRLADLKSNMSLLEAQRLEQRTYYDIEMIEEMGFCHGIENYSRHFTGRNEGQPPPTLVEYFPDNFLCIIDESHITVPQLGGMYRGDRARKENLVNHGFRLPSALDNRPLRFDEFNSFLYKTLYVSATPGDYELEKVEGEVVEQVIRPTGLLDPKVEVRPATSQVKDLLQEARKVIKRGNRVLVTTLTKRSAEDLTDYYQQQDIKVAYLHSDIQTFERTEIIQDLRLGKCDVLVGINLLREGLDLPEVQLVAVLDADKEGFLRSTRSLIQVMGRASRNAKGYVVLYADRVTRSMKTAIDETKRRRAIQNKFNKEHNIVPKTIKSAIKSTLYESYTKTSPIKEKRGGLEEIKDFKEIKKQVDKLREKMAEHSSRLEFEEAARIRDQIKKLEFFELDKR